MAGGCRCESWCSSSSACSDARAAGAAKHGGQVADLVQAMLKELVVKKHSPSSRAFTLVELLVVIAIITILIAVLLPVLSRVRQQAQQTVCAANLHQLGHAMAMYTGQYGYFPGCFVVVKPAGNLADCLPVRLRKILRGNQRVFYCPAQDARCQWLSDAPGSVMLAQDFHVQFGYEFGERLIVDGDPPTLGGKPPNGSFRSYGCNLGGSYGGPGVALGRGMGLDVFYQDGTRSPNFTNRRPTSVKSASEFIIMADASSDGWSDGVIRPDNSTPFNTSVGVLSNAIGNVHRGGANVLFCDGHVQWFLQSDLMIQMPPVEQEASKQRRWNADNEPAGKW